MHKAVKQALQHIGVAGDFRAVGVGADLHAGDGPQHTVRSPIDGSTLAELPMATPEQVAAAANAAAAALPVWRDTPAPVRGELVRRIGDAFREHQAELATLVTWEVGKIPSEANGEVQEVIDICDFAVGLSRQLYGRTIASERPGHRLTEYWHPLGPVGVISAFNFPLAVWAWNAMIGLV
jgi:aldehyde dehydrogenase (NAD+)